MHEPENVNAGDTVTWSETFNGYSAADGWALTYYLRGPMNVDITGVASGSGFTLTLTAAQSAPLPPGTYSYIARASKLLEVYTVSSGTITIKANLATAAPGYESRTKAQIIVEGIEDWLSTKGVDCAQELNAAGVNVQYMTMKEINQTLSYWKRVRASELKAEKIARGETGGGQILYGFGR